MWQRYAAVAVVAHAFLAPPRRPAPSALGRRAQPFDGDPYEMLGVERGASKADLRKAFRAPPRRRDARGDAAGR